MGAYLFTLRKTGTRNTEAGKVYPYEFHDRCKAWYTERFYHAGTNEYWSAHELQQMRLEAKRHRFFRGNWRNGNAMLVSLGNESGALVYRQENPEFAYNDIGAMGGELVGVLRKVGRKWAVVSIESELETYKEVVEGYAKMNGISSLMPTMPCGSIELDKAAELCRRHYRENNNGEICEALTEVADNFATFIKLLKRDQEANQDSTSFAA